MLGFSNNSSFTLSKPLFAILVTTILLAILLATSTVRNIRREQEITESFLLDEGLTLIRSFEAGARTTMRHHMQPNSQPLATLVQETAKTPRIAYITIITEDGTIVATAGNHLVSLDSPMTSQVLKTRQPVTRMVNDSSDDPVFEVTAVFQSLPSESPPMMGMMRMHNARKSLQTRQLEAGRAVIHLGLHTGEFVKARKQDLHHSLFMGGLLFLVGTAGFYFLFLYQGMQVTRATLANMKLYTKNIIESMPDGLLTLDSSGRIVSCNPRILEFAEMDMSQLSGKKPKDIFANWPLITPHPDSATTPFSYTFIQQDGSQIPVEISSSPLLDDQGKTLGAVYLLRDLRTIRAMEEQLARSRRLAALGKMAAGIAHEIRNPLGTLRGFAQYFASSSKDDAAKEYSSLMIGEVDRLNDSISALLQFSRPRTPEFTQVQPDEILTKSIKLLEYDFKEKDIQLTSEFQCTSSIEVDQDLLLQVMLNLLKNAINASPDHGTMGLFCREEENNVLITVTDKGSGMNITEKGKMFDPFFTTKSTGTGLGLAVSHQIVEQHNGRFEVITQPDKGTTITIILPRKHNAMQVMT